MLTITPITKQYVTIDVASALASGAPAVISGVDVALVQPRSAPVGTTAWTSAAYASGTATVLVAGYDADPTGALVIPAGWGADLWIRVVDNPEVTATKVTRVIVEPGADDAPAVTSTTPFVQTVAGLSGIVSAGAAVAALGLGNVNNTSDANKPVSTAQAAAVTAAQAFAVQRANHTGTQSADTLTDGTTNKAFLATERTKLAGVATGATAYTDAQAQSANATALAAKANIADIPTAGTATGDALRTAFVPSAPRRAEGANVVRMMQANSAGHTWTTGGAGLGTANANDTSDPYLGTQCITLTSNGTTSSMFAKTAGLALDCTGRDLRIWFKYDSAANMNNIQLLLGDAALANTYTAQVVILTPTTDGAGYPAQPGAWNVIDIPFSFFTIAGTPTRASIDTIRINGLAKSGQTTTLKIGGVATIAEDEKSKWPNGVVTLCFDDCFDGQWNVARPYLDTYGDRATYFPILGALDVGGAWTLARLKQLHDQGNEVGAHATTNATHAQALTGMTSAQRAAELQALRQWLRANGFSSDSYAYPNGSWNPGITQDVAPYFAAGRLAFGSYIGNVRPVLPLSLASIAGQVSGLTSYVDQAKTNKGWCVFTIHDVNAGGGGNSTTTANFTALVDYCHAQGVPIRTMGEVLQAA